MLRDGLHPFYWHLVPNKTPEKPPPTQPETIESTHASNSVPTPAHPSQSHYTFHISLSSNGSPTQPTHAPSALTSPAREQPNALILNPLSTHRSRALSASSTALFPAQLGCPCSCCPGCSLNNDAPTRPVSCCCCCWWCCCCWGFGICICGWESGGEVGSAVPWVWCEDAGGVEGVDDGREPLSCIWLSSPSVYVSRVWRDWGEGVGANRSGWTWWQ